MIRQCDVCAKIFPHVSSLEAHLRSHTGEKPFKCAVCTKSFRQKSHLKTHIRTHTGEKPFQCDVCNKSFSRRNFLQIHSRTHTGEKPFKCAVCGKSFSQKSHLHSHMHTHNGEKPFKCPKCNVKFKRGSSFRRHLQWTHTGKNAFECMVCHKDFNTRGDLRHHVRNHIGEKLFDCTVSIEKLSEFDVPAAARFGKNRASKDSESDTPADGAPSNDLNTRGDLWRNVFNDTVKKLLVCTVSIEKLSESDVRAAARIAKNRASKASESDEPADGALADDAPDDGEPEDDSPADDTAACTVKKRASKASVAPQLARKGKKQYCEESRSTSPAGFNWIKAESADEGSTRGEQSYDVPSASTLPSAVLVQVLSWLPVADLLRAAQVSRRWRVVAARPEAWRRADVVMTSGNCKQQVWLLERAPQLRLLDMSGLSTADDFGFQDDLAVWDAWERLDSMDCPVQQLDIRVERDSCAKIGLLARWGPQLKRLKLRLGTWHSQFGREYGQMHLAIKMVGSVMNQLTHLDLTYELQDGALGGYDQELGKGCPALVSFTFHFPTVRDHGLWKEVVLDVLTHKSGQLTELALFPSDKCPEVPAELWPAIGRCTQLRRLAVPTPPGLAVVGQLPLLRDLSLQPSAHACLDEETRGALLADHAVLGALQRLELHLPPTAPRTHGPGPVRSPSDHMAAMLDNLLSRTCSQVRCLSLTGGCFPAAVLAGLLGDVARMPALAELRLRAVGGIEARHLDQLSAAGRLKVIRLEDVSVKHDILVWSTSRSNCGAHTCGGHL